MGYWMSSTYKPIYDLSRRYAVCSMRLAAIVIFVVEVDVLHWQEICMSELRPSPDV